MVVLHLSHEDVKKKTKNFILSKAKVGEHSLEYYKKL